MWRLRTEIYSEAVIDLGSITTATVIIRISEFNNENPEAGDATLPNFRLCDVFLVKEEKDIHEAFVILFNEINCFIDRLSLVSYGKVALHNILSVAPETVEIGEVFEVAIPQAMVSRKVKNIGLENLKYDTPLTPEQQRWERLLRIGLSSVSEEEKYINYYSLLEEIARHESNEFIVTKCANCQHETNTNRKKTNNFIRNLMEKHGVDKKTADNAEAIRNKIAHGGANKDKFYFSEVARIGSHLEEICLLELEERFRIEIVNRLNFNVPAIPMFIHTCVCISDNDFDFVSSKHLFEARFIKLKHSDESKFQNQTVVVGTPLTNERPQIFDVAYPQILVPLNKQEEIIAYNKIGELYYTYQELDKALPPYSKALDLAKSSNETEFIAIGYANLKKVYQKKGDKPNAKLYTRLRMELLAKLPLGASSKTAKKHRK